MKKAFVFAALIALAGVVPAVAGSCNVKGVNDSTDGKIYYAPDHRLYKHVQISPNLGDRMFCSVDQAESAGYEEAPDQFSDSTAKLVDCLEEGGCRNYVQGIYQSLEIYDKVCGPSSISSDILAQDVIEHANDNPSQMDVEKFYGATGAFLEKYSCPTTLARKES